MRESEAVREIREVSEMLARQRADKEAEKAVHIAALKEKVVEAAKIIKSDRDRLDNMQPAPGWRYNLERFSKAVDALVDVEAA